MFRCTEPQQLGFLPGIAVAAGSSFPPVGAVLAVAAAGVSLFDLFKNWAERGELKRTATAKAEDFVKAFYAQGGQLPQPGQPIEPGGNLFDRDTVAGMIEACNLSGAKAFLDLLERQGLELSRVDGYFAAWWTQYGSKDISNLNGTINAAVAYCSTEQPLPTTAPNTGITTPGTTPVTQPGSFTPGNPPSSTTPKPTAEDDSSLWIGGGIAAAAALVLVFALS